MFLEITDVILIALFIEAIVNAIKPIWTKGETQLTVSEYVSMGMGVLLAVTCKINMLAYVVEAVDHPLWVEYIFYVLTGIAIGRGTNFLYDLWSKLKEWKSGDLLLRSKDVFVDTMAGGTASEKDTRRSTRTRRLTRTSTFSRWLLLPLSFGQRTSRKRTSISPSGFRRRGLSASAMRTANT